MTHEQILVWGVLALLILLFASGRLLADAVALSGLLILTLGGVLTPQAALSGFASPVVITLAGLLLLSAALERSGTVRWCVRWMHRTTGNGRRRLLFAGTLLPGLLSGFINIIATVSVFIPVLLRLALKTGHSPARMLLPMAVVAMAGANLTLIGSSHNIMVDGLLREHAGTGLSFFEFLPVGLVMVAAATVYALLMSARLLPAREIDTNNDVSPAEQTRDLLDRYRIADRIWEVGVQETSADSSLTVGELQLYEHGLSLVALVRADDDSRPVVGDDTELEAGDILLLGGRRERVESLVDAVEGIELEGAPSSMDEFSAGDAELVEVMVPARSPVIGVSIHELGLHQRTGLTAIALWRDGEPVRTNAQSTPLEAGDAVLLYGDSEHTLGFDAGEDFHWLHESREHDQQSAGPWHRGLAIAVFSAVILAAATGLLPVEIAVLCGALAVAAAGLLPAEGVYRCIDWRMLVLIAALLPFAGAFMSSGASSQLAALIVGVVGDAGPVWLLLLVASFALLLTQVLHNTVVAAIMVPVSLDIAAHAGIEPTGLAVAVIVAASMSLLLPVGHPAGLLVQRPGRYTVLDYLKFGSGMLLITLAVILIMVPMLWPFHPA